MKKKSSNVYASMNQVRFTAETAQFLADIGVDPDSPQPVGFKPPTGRRGKRLANYDDFIPSMPRSFFMAVLKARADLDPVLLLWRLTKMWRQGAKIPVSTGRIAKELRCSPQWVSETWRRLERAGLITIQRRLGRPSLIELKDVSQL
jgi:hypothetical protein